MRLLNRRDPGSPEDIVEGMRGGYHLRLWAWAFRARDLSRATLQKELAPKQGQSLVELALVVPVLLILVFAIVGFGILYEDKITMDTAARDGARWATQNPAAWDNSPTAAILSIQGQIQAESGPSMVPNDNTHINISYYKVSSLTSPMATYCGEYDQSRDSVVYPDSDDDDSDRNITPFPNTKLCLADGNLIKVTVTHKFPLPFPIISEFFPGEISLQASATMMEEK